MVKKIEISSKTIIFIIGVLILLWFLIQIIDVIMALFVAVLLMAILDAPVSKLSRYRIPRSVSVMVVYIVTFGLFASAVGFVASPLIEQTTSFAKNFPGYVQNIGISSTVIEQANSEIAAFIGSLPTYVVKLSVTVFSNIWALFSVLILAFYLLTARDRLDDQVSAFFGDEKRKPVQNFLNDLEERLGGWFRAQIALMLIIGLSVYIGLTILGIPYALPLAIFSGLLEIIPMIGPIISSIPIVLIGFGISPVMGLTLLGFVILVQALENYLLVPKLFERSIGVSPIATILAFAIGSKVAGVTGVLLSVPVLLVFQIIYKRFVLQEK